MSLPKNGDYEVFACNLHRDLKLRFKIAAAKKGQSMTDYVASLLEEKLTTPKTR